MTTLVWFRNDLRVADNPALAQACSSGRVVACFVVSDLQWQEHDVGERRLAFLGRAVNALAQELAELGIQFNLINAPRFADVPNALLELIRRIGASKIVFNAEYPGNERLRDDAVTAAMQKEGVEVSCFHGGVTMPPGSVMTRQEMPFSVYTPFRRRWLERVQPDQIRPLQIPAPQGSAIPMVPLKSLARVSLKLGSESWPAGEREARQQLVKFIEDRIDQYANDRNSPGLRGTSNLSAHLSVGSLSSNQCLNAVALLNNGRLQGSVTDAWMNQAETD